MGNFVSKVKAKRTSAQKANPTITTTTDTMGDAKTPIKMTHYAGAQKTFDPPLIAHDNHFLGDVSTSGDEKMPITAGFYHFKPGTPLEYTYTYEEMKIILEGEGTLKDGSGQEVHAKAGDVFYFPKGSVITFSTERPEGVKAFFCGQRARGAA
ncbi:hypothetical protein PMZ80_001967 [Knufia obscura]|uniref:Ethanolamine utilization protein n=2 Tax=Knufia TaxID=430999 RepID=A0AAN8EGU6_9EURO|nr:hypothetical protein PMZ80_001967 [Knufia obscura]KAK5953785.1 hypothetical protein OHC33_005054 [Knufia fluminis]